MNKDKLLTIRFNNIITAGLGIPALIFVALVFFTSTFTDKTGFLGIIAIGIIYCVIVEQHSEMTLSCLMEKSGNAGQSKPGLSSRIILFFYNLAWWIPIVLPLIEITDYRQSAVLFFFITLTRACINLYRVNLLPLVQAVNFPLRSP